MTLAADEDAPALARRRAVRAVGRRLQGHRRNDLELLVSEVVSNAVIHGTGDITFVLRPDGGSIRVEVSDASTEVPRPQATTGAHGGFGLRLVAELADSWGVDAHARGKTVWFCL